MSPITTFADVETYSGHATKPKRSFARWLQLETRAILIAVKRNRSRRAGLRALEAMDDRLLADIGVDRGQIRAAVDGHR